MHQQDGDLLSRSLHPFPDEATRSTPSLSAIEIDLENIAHNVGELRRLLNPGVAFCAVIKAGAYGHGLIPVARAVVRAGADYLAIASVDEAMRLRAAGIQAPCLKVIPSLPEEMEASLEAGIEEVVGDVESARGLARAARRIRVEGRVHVNVDTGMGRQGILARRVVEAVSAISRFRGIRMVGLMTHFAEADAADRSFTEQQIRTFKDVIERLAERGIRPRLIHAANSAGLIHFPDSHFSMVRPGIALYGAYPSPGSHELVSLRPGMSFRTRVVQIRELPAGSTISYGRTFRLERAARIATLPVGYAGGLLRSLSNRGQVIIRGCRHPIVGRVTMNLINVRVADGVPVEAGDEAVLLGKQGTETITAEELAEWTGTISYEVLTSLGGLAARKAITYRGPEGELVGEISRSRSG